MRTIPTELQEKLAEIRSWLFDGDQKVVAKRSRSGEGHVSRVLNGKMNPNKKILDTAIEVMNENKARFEIGVVPPRKVA